MFIDSPINHSTLASGSSARNNIMSDQMVLIHNCFISFGLYACLKEILTSFYVIQGSRKFKFQSSSIEWSGVAWICSKQLKHYPAFIRNEIPIMVSSPISSLESLSSIWSDFTGEQPNYFSLFSFFPMARFIPLYL